ncbi:MAG: sigma-70 family RNA polymerase sigma factor [Bacteroidia bacterium]
MAKKQEADIRDLDDAALVRRYQTEGDQECIAVLMDRYASQIVAFGIRQLNSQEDVRDFANDVYLKLTDKLKSANPDNFKSWLYVFMRNMCHDKGRRQVLAETFVQHQKQMHQDYEEEDLDKTLDHAQLHTAIDELSEKEAEVIRLMYLQELNYQEAMQATGLTYNQLRGIRNRAMEKLRAQLSKRLKP